MLVIVPSTVESTVFVVQPLDPAYLTPSQRFGASQSHPLMSFQHTSQVVNILVLLVLLAEPLVLPQELLLPVPHFRVLHLLLYSFPWSPPRRVMKLFYDGSSYLGYPSLF
uniref:Uncharacterized protein n=1 Tax=uncultured marine virus TaxID=186617 RepID=A0A0F7L606_9VIRU|nr:hypothetical protein [uncultured marine virus]